MRPAKPPRGIRVHPSRSADFRAGHRVAARSAVAWLHQRATEMNDPRAVAILNAAADDLGHAFLRGDAGREPEA